MTVTSMHSNARSSRKHTSLQDLIPLILIRLQQTAGCPRELLDQLYLAKAREKVRRLHEPASGLSRAIEDQTDSALRALSRLDSGVTLRSEEYEELVIRMEHVFLCLAATAV